MIKHFALVTVLLLVSVAPAHASTERAPPLPPEGFAACAEKQEGDACTAQFRGMEIHGVCASVPERGLFCRPSGAPPGPS